MFSFLTYACVPVVGAFLYLDGYSIVKNTVLLKWGKFRKINELVATNYKGLFIVIWISLCMVIQALWISMLQYMNSAIVPVKGGCYEVTYVIKGKTYKMLVKPVRGPRKVLLVSDENEDDVSYKIFPFLGPAETFHGKKYTPGFFGCSELVFELSDGTERIFKVEEDIVLSEELALVSDLS